MRMQSIIAKPECQGICSGSLRATAFEGSSLLLPLEGGRSGGGLTGFAVQAGAAGPFPRRRRISVGDPSEVQIVTNLTTASTCKILRRELHTLE